VRHLDSRPRRGLLAPAALCLLLTGCALRFNARTLGVPVTMAAAAGQAVPGDSFRVTLRATHMFWGLASATAPNLQHALGGQLGTGGAIANLDIHARKRWSDVLVSALTLGFVSSTTVTFSGVVVRGTP